MLHKKYGESQKEPILQKAKKNQQQANSSKNCKSQNAMNHPRTGGGVGLTCYVFSPSRFYKKMEIFEFKNIFNTEYL